MDDESDSDDNDDDDDGKQPDEMHDEAFLSSTRHVGTTKSPQRHIEV